MAPRKEVTAPNDAATHYDIRVNAPVEIAGAMLLPNQNIRIKAKWLAVIPKEAIVSAVALTIEE